MEEVKQFCFMIVSQELFCPRQGLRVFLQYVERKEEKERKKGKKEGRKQGRGRDGVERRGYILKENLSGLLNNSCSFSLQNQKVNLKS